MSSRFVIPVMCVGAVAFACGPRGHNEASAPVKSGTAIVAANSLDAMVKQQGAPRKMRGTDSDLEARVFVLSQESSIRFTLYVVNSGKKRVELTFPTGQTHDFVILDTVGREVWRWGRDRMFTQALRNRLLGGGESLELEEEVSRATLVPGRYTARAMLTSENYPLVQEAEFTVQPATLASR